MSWFRREMARAHDPDAFPADIRGAFESLEWQIEFGSEPVDVVALRRAAEAGDIRACQSHARDNPRAASFYAAKAAWLVAGRRA